MCHTGEWMQLRKEERKKKKRVKRKKKKLVAKCYSSTMSLYYVDVRCIELFSLLLLLLLLLLLPVLLISMQALGLFVGVCAVVACWADDDVDDNVDDDDSEISTLVVSALDESPHGWLVEDAWAFVSCSSELFDSFADSSVSAAAEPCCCCCSCCCCWALLPRCVAQSALMNEKPRNSSWFIALRIIGSTGVNAASSLVKSLSKLLVSFSSFYLHFLFVSNSQD